MDITSYLLGKNSASGGGGGGSDLDWTALGYTKRPQAIDDGYDYAKQIKDNWVPATSLYNKFQRDYQLTYFPLVDTSTTNDMQYMFYECFSLQETALFDTSNVTKAQNMFNWCHSLTEIPLFDLSNLTHAQYMFGGCYSLKKFPAIKIPNLKYGQSMFTNCKSLSNDSLKNILDICINATQYMQTKTLAYLGFDSTHQPVATIQALPNYQSFIDAGWTIGYE